MYTHEYYPREYNKLRNIYKYHIDSYIALYQLKTEKEEELRSIYKMIKTGLIDSNKYPPTNAIKDILDIIPYNNRYTKSYLFLAKLVSDDYHVTDVINVEPISNFLFYKEYGIKLNKSFDFEKIKTESLDIHTVYKAIMYNDKESFITFTERDGFDKNQKLKCKLYPYSEEGYSLLELCCYYGAIDCFKFLITKFDSEITEKCLELSFLGRNQEIMSECLKHQEPDEECMKYAIISHNIDFVTFLMNEYNIDIDLYWCGLYNNLESFLVCLNQTDDITKCFVYSPIFNIPSFLEYFLSHGENVKQQDEYGKTALHIAAMKNSKENAEILISHGANINEKDKYEKTALHIATYNNSKETAEVLILHGANINENNKNGEIALHIAAMNNSKETAELLILHGANINEKDEYGETVLHNAVHYNSKETAEVLILHGANINEKYQDGKTALRIAAKKNSKEIVEFLISHGANINEKYQDGNTALHIAAMKNSKEIVELLISHGANINEQDQYGKTALHIAAMKNSKEIAELLISHGANINEQDQYGETALHIATYYNSKETAELLISHSTKK